VKNFLRPVALDFGFLFTDIQDVTQNEIMS